MRLQVVLSLLNDLQILAFTGDNATSNDKQTDKLDALPNSFESVNRVRCFNHTMQLSAKALLKPFSSVASADKDDPSNDNDSDVDEDDGMPMLQAIDEEDEDSYDSEDDEDDEDEEEDPLDALDEEERKHLMQNTTAVRNTLNKVYFIRSYIYSWG